LREFRGIRICKGHACLVRPLDHLKVRGNIRKCPKVLSAPTSALPKQCSTYLPQSYGLGAKVHARSFAGSQRCQFTKHAALGETYHWCSQVFCNGYLVPVSMDWQMQDFTWCKLPSAWRKKCVRSASWRSMTDCSARSSAFSFSDPLSCSAPTTFWSAPFGAFCEAELRKVRLRREDLYHMYRCLPSNSLHCCAIQVCLL